MKMNQIKTDSALLNTTPGIPSVIAQSKILPYIRKNYSLTWPEIEFLPWRLGGAETADALEFLEARPELSPPCRHSLPYDMRFMIAG